MATLVRVLPRHIRLVVDFLVEAQVPFSVEPNVPFMVSHFDVTVPSYGWAQGVLEVCHAAEACQPHKVPREHHGAE